MRIVLLGPPGSGKGAQAQRLAARTGARHISTGALVRAEIQASTPLGRALQGYADRGELVPDASILALARAALGPARSWILDGFPRTEAQARALDALLAQAGVALDRVVALNVPDDVIVARLAGRRQSLATARVYHVAYDPPGPDDPGPFVQRADDRPQTIRRRLAIYHATAGPLVRYYRERGLLAEVDAGGAIEAVADAVLAALPHPAAAG